MKGFTKIIRGTHRETRRSAAVTPFGAGQNACSVQVPGTLQSWKRAFGRGRRRKMADLVLWSFVVGFTPLVLALGWKLITSVGDLMWYRHSPPLQEFRRKRSLCPQNSASYRVLGR